MKMVELTKVKIARQSDGIHDEHEELLKSLKSPQPTQLARPKTFPRRTSLRAPSPACGACPGRAPLRYGHSHGATTVRSVRQKDFYFPASVDF